MPFGLMHVFVIFYRIARKNLAAMEESDSHTDGICLSTEKCESHMRDLRKLPEAISEHGITPIANKCLACF